MLYLIGFFVDFVYKGLRTKINDLKKISFLPVFDMSHRKCLVLSGKQFISPLSSCTRTLSAGDSYSLSPQG